MIFPLMSCLHLTFLYDPVHNNKVSKSSMQIVLSSHKRCAALQSLFDFFGCAFVF